MESGTCESGGWRYVLMEMCEQEMKRGDGWYVWREREHAARELCSERDRGCHGGSPRGCEGLTLSGSVRMGGGRV